MHIIEAPWIVPVVPTGHFFEQHALVIEQDRITAIMPADQARIAYPDATITTLSRHILLPGLVNTHTHAAMTLMRGFADDLPLMAWLQDAIWPAESRHVSPSFVYDGTLLAIAESIRGGVTCVNDMYFYPGSAAQAAMDTGMRMALGLLIMQFSTRYAANTEDYFSNGLALYETLRHTKRLSFCLAPHAPYTLTDADFERIALLAEQYNLPIHLHLHETIDEIQQSLAEYGVRPVERLDRLGILSPRLLAVHAVQLCDDDIALLAKQGCHMIHCPSANLKLASGIAPVAACLSAGVPVALGTDGAASNNRLDLFEEMRLAALLAKGSSGHADILPAHKALHLATLAGAEALGLASHIGSLEPGKQADIIAVDLSAADLSPCYDPISHLVYVASRRDVSHVWIDGALLLSDGVLTQFDMDALRKRVTTWQNTLRPLRHE